MSLNALSCRIRQVNQCELRPSASHVVYWMIAFRRPRWNRSLDRAIELAKETKKPLIVLEALRVGYPWASDRLHQFIVDGMKDNEESFRSAPVSYYPYLEEKAGDGSGLLEALSKDAVAVVTDDFPSFFLPKMITAAGKKLEKVGARLEAIDGNGVYPMRDTERVFTRAMDFRRHLQKELPKWLQYTPTPEPLDDLKLTQGEIPSEILEKWPPATDALQAGTFDVSKLDIDHSVPVVEEKGGEKAAIAKFNRFMKIGFPTYGKDRNHPDNDTASGISPYLHFGHLSADEMFWRIAEEENWNVKKIAKSTATGKRTGFWHMRENAEGYFEELLVWRELGYNMAALDPEGYDKMSTLPNWAHINMEEHKDDERPHVYTLEQLEKCETHDDVWNAAQRQLMREGRIHNYLRMVWGKKILQWSETYEDAVNVMLELNNKWALDGRNPNSYSGIFWCLGRYDRAWGPVRPIFGKFRYMCSTNTKKKLKMKEYLKKYGGETETKKRKSPFDMSTSKAKRAKRE